jgi:hypothetical protein
MKDDYFYTLPPQPPVTGYEYNKNCNLEAVGYFALLNADTLTTVPEYCRPLVTELADIDSGDVILEYDLEQVTDTGLSTPAVFKALGYPDKFAETLDCMWRISGLTPHPLPVLPSGTRYTHIGAFINRPNSGLRLNISGGGHYVKQFILANGGDAYWFDQYEHYQAFYIASCDFIDGAVQNIRLEIHRGISLQEVPELRDDPWVKVAWTHCQEAIQSNYPSNTPKLIISHYKVGANTRDISNGYLKVYTEAQWANA